MLWVGKQTNKQKTLRHPISGEGFTCPQYIKDAKSGNKHQVYIAPGNAVGQLEPILLEGPQSAIVILEHTLASSFKVGPVAIIILTYLVKWKFMFIQKHECLQ